MFPGFKHVEVFGKDEEYEEEVEVSYVTLDLGTNVDKSLVPNTSEYRLIGLDTESPMLQLSGTFFKGVHEQLIGTEILLTDGRDDSNLSRKFVIPVSTTEKRIKFEPVEIKEKESVEHSGTDAQKRAPIHPSGSGKARAKGKGRGRGGVGRLQDHYGESVMDLNISSSVG